MRSFSELSLPEPITIALLKLNFSVPTPIQAQSIPTSLSGSDLIACAETGSGKTLAFGIPMIVKLLADPSANALVLAPTRELAKQISEVISQLTVSAPDLRMAVLLGGADMEKQFRALKRGPRIVIATPGRLKDHLHRHTVKLDNTRFLVLDEGDRMLDMGFAPQLDAILKYLPRQRQTLLFSATIPPKVKELAKKYLSNPAHVTIGSDSRPPSTIKQTALHTTHEKKNDLLMDELNARAGSVIVFTRTKHRTDRVARFLEEYGFSVSRLHGGRSQGQRNSALQGFRDGKFRILVATDLAARGIDVPQIAHVINYDLPMMDEDYIHRIGRTARAGGSGEALSLLTNEDKNKWLMIVRKYKISGGSENIKFDAGNGRQGPKPGSRNNSHNGRPENRHGDRSENRHGDRSDGRQNARHENRPGGRAENHYGDKDETQRRDDKPVSHDGRQPARDNRNKPFGSPKKFNKNRSHQGRPSNLNY